MNNLSTITDGAHEVFDPTSRDIIFYGPHSCNKCGEMIAKASFEQGGFEYTYPREGPYPNSEWQAHECDPADVERVRSIRSFPQQSPDK